MQKYYALQEYSSNQSLVRSEENTDGAKNQVILDDYNYINKLSGKERNQIVKDFNNLKKKVMIPNPYINGTRENEMPKVQRKLQEYIQITPTNILFSAHSKAWE